MSRLFGSGSKLSHLSISASLIDSGMDPIMEIGLLCAVHEADLGQNLIFQ